MICNIIDKKLFYWLCFHSLSSKVKAKQETELELESFAPPYVCIEWLLRYHFQKLFTLHISSFVLSDEYTAYFRHFILNYICYLEWNTLKMFIHYHHQLNKDITLMQKLIGLIMDQDYPVFPQKILKRANNF